MYGIRDEISFQIREADLWRRSGAAVVRPPFFLVTLKQPRTSERTHTYGERLRKYEETIEKMNVW